MMLQCSYKVIKIAKAFQGEFLLCDQNFPGCITSSNSFIVDYNSNYTFTFHYYFKRFNSGRHNYTSDFTLTENDDLQSSTFSVYKEGLNNPFIEKKNFSPIKV